jgi:hypothetical protein
MVSPLSVGTAATVVAPIRKKRNSIRFQNSGTTQIYLKKIPLEGAYSVVSATDYEVVLYPTSSSQEGGEAFETDSILSFMAISPGTAGILAVYETIKS